MKFIKGENLRKEISESKAPILLMFWSYDCMACDVSNQHMFKLSDIYGDKMNFYKIDSQKNLDIVEAYGISTIPTFIFFENGKICGKIEGYRKKIEIEKKIREFL